MLAEIQVILLLLMSIKHPSITFSSDWNNTLKTYCMERLSKTTEIKNAEMY